jgi:hypothetical protein
LRERRPGGSRAPLRISAESASLGSCARVLTEASARPLWCSGCERLVGPRGLEPRTCGLRVRCSARLS